MGFCPHKNKQSCHSQPVYSFKLSNRNPRYRNLVVLPGSSLNLLYSSALFGFRSFTFILRDVPHRSPPPRVQPIVSECTFLRLDVVLGRRLSLTTLGETQLKRGEGETRLTVQTATHNAQGAQFVLKMLKPKKKKKKNL